MTSTHIPSTNLQFHSKALAQIILLKHRLSEQSELEQQIRILREKLHAKQSKHRRCDKQIEKSYNCQFCQRIYASDVALKLHLKLKHASQSPTKTAIQKNSHTHNQDTEHISCSVEQNQKIIMELQ